MIKPCTIYHSSPKIWNKNKEILNTLGIEGLGILTYCIQKMHYKDNKVYYDVDVPMTCNQLANAVKIPFAVLAVHLCELEDIGVLLLDKGEITISRDYAIKCDLEYEKQDKEYIIYRILSELPK